MFGERQLAFAHDRQELTNGAGRRFVVEHPEDDVGPRVRVLVDPVAESRDAFAVAEPTADGLGRCGLDRLADEQPRLLARSSVERPAENGQTGLQHQVGIRPRRRRDARGERRRRELVVGEQYQHAVEELDPALRRLGRRHARPQARGEGRTGTSVLPTVTLEAVDERSDRGSARVGDGHGAPVGTKGVGMAHRCQCRPEPVDRRK